MKLKSLIGIVFVFSCLSTFAQSSPQTVAEFMVQTGLKDQVAQLDGMIQTKIEEKKSTFAKPEQFDLFKKIMTSGMNSKSAEKYIVEYLEKYTGEDSLKQVVVLYKDPFMQEFNRIEKESGTPASRQKMPAYFESFKTTPPVPERVQQLLSLTQDMKAAEIAVKMIRNVVVAMIKGGNNSLPKAEQVSDIEITGQMDVTFNADYEKQMTNQMLAYSLFVYKDVPDEKLNRYLEVWKTPTGKYCMDRIMKAYDYAFSKMGEITGGSFPTLGEEKK